MLGTGHIQLGPTWESWVQKEIRQNIDNLRFRKQTTYDMQTKENRYFEPHEIEGKIDHIQKELLKAIQVNPESRYVKRLTNSLQCWQQNYKDSIKRN